ncbi:TDRD5 protein, partial [Geococcyx californianus]|nr:TDRD5 protein [Geococcyx californianus]
MSKQVQLMEMLKKEVRSLLMAAQEGLTPAQLEQEYLTMIGKPLPLHDLGFQSTLELMAKMPEVVRISSHGKGTFILKAIADETTTAIAKLVARQKRNVKARKGAGAKAGAASHCRNIRTFPHRTSASALPAAVKAELQDLLSSSPLLLVNFDKAYRRRFGRVFQYTQYGFFSMAEVLRSVSDIIVVEQTRAGSLLTLKKNLTNEIEKEEVPQSTPAVEVPPLEPICESFHLAAEEKSEPVKTQAVDLNDVLKQVSGRISDLWLFCVLIQGCQDLKLSQLYKLEMIPEIPPDAVQDRRLCSLSPPERDSLMGVSVEFIISPSQFYIHICGTETSDKLQDMMFDMRRCYSSELVSDRYIMPESSVQPGQLCCLMDSKWWYRVIIHRVINDQEVEVFYADYGNLGIVQKSCLRFLKWCYLKLPAQAVPCSLACVKPVEGTWSSDATLLFKQLCTSKLLVGIVDKYLNGVLHLFLCDTSAKEDIYLHFVLSNRGCADICRESIPSQGFEELNPSALYIQPSEKQENAEPMEPNLCLQQESLEADSKTESSNLNEDELCDKPWHLSVEEEIQDVWPVLDEASVLRTTDQDPELTQEDTNETPAELMAVLKTPPSLGKSSIPVVLFKSVEDIYTSFIHTKQPAERSQDDPDQIERFSKKAELHEALHPSILLMAMPFMLDNPNNKEEVKNKDLLGSLEDDLCSDEGLSNQKQSLKLFVPSTTLAAVFTAACLATSSGYFQWFSSLRESM